MKLHPSALIISALICSACSGATNGIHPGPKGTAVVVFEADGLGGLRPVACYDPLWVELRGPQDCADLVPPGAQVRLATGGVLTVTDRGPAACGVRLAVQGAGAGLAEWATDGVRRLRDAQLDLNGDGLAEQLVQRAQRWVLPPLGDGCAPPKPDDNPA
jgi:hypothetical protein